jgi:hypothetical protein
MSQTRAKSMLEVVVNIAIGYTINLGAQLLIFPMFGIDIPLRDNIGIGMAFTVISLTRSYLIRRWFNKEREEA